MTSKQMFSKISQNFLKLIYPCFLQGFYEKTYISDFVISCQNAPLEKQAAIRQKKKTGMSSALSSSLLSRKPKKVFVSPSSNMMKLGNTWETTQSYQHNQLSEEKHINAMEACGSLCMNFVTINVLTRTPFAPQIPAVQIQLFQKVRPLPDIINCLTKRNI